LPFRLIVSERGVDHYRYVPAYSTRLNYESGTWRVLPSDSSDPMGMVDPVWTESNWDTIRLRVYTVQDAAFDRLVLLAGITITVMAYLAIVLTRASIAKALKRDWSIILVLVNFMNILHRNGRIRSKNKWFYHNPLLKSLVFFFLNIGLDATLFELHPLSYTGLSSLKSSFSNGWVLMSLFQDYFL